MNSYNFIIDKLNYTSNSININKFSLSVPNKILFEDSLLNLSPCNIYGLIGKNGSGKTSLLKQLALNNIFAENKIKVLYVEQELEMNDENPVDFIFNANTIIANLTKEIESIEHEIENNDDYDNELDEKYRILRNQLLGINKNTEYGKIKSILNGLGFTQNMMNQSCNIFSGGWRMRISLARSLYIEPELLLLDEPTNHLDLEAIIWLGNYMKSWKNIALIVSHNIGFLNDICSNIINIEHKKLVFYKGNYYKFKEALEQKVVEEKNKYDKYEKKLKEFRKKNTKVQVEEFIKKNQVSRPEQLYNVSINFLQVPQFKSHIIKFNDVSFSYDNNEILKNINFGIDMNTRITIVGINGSGKSTILKLIMGNILPCNGNIWLQNNLRIGYYNQHFEEYLPLDKTPIEYLCDIIPQSLIENDKIKTIRYYLGSVKLEGSAHTKLIGELSGGQKARVYLINLIFQQPHILLLDEPTNHLDIETVEGLINGLNKYEGGIILITHEPELINKLDTEIWIMNPENKNIEMYNKTFTNYSEMILAKLDS